MLLARSIGVRSIITVKIVLYGWSKGNEPELAAISRGNFYRLVKGMIDRLVHSQVVCFRSFGFALFG